MRRRHKRWPRAARRELAAEEQGELRTLWKKLVNLYHRADRAGAPPAP